MKEIAEIRKDVEGLKDHLKSKGIHQFTIDLVEETESELLEQEIGESHVDDATMLGALAYKIDTVLEIASSETEDYIIFQKLKLIIEEARS